MYDPDHIFSGDPTIPGLLEAVRDAGIVTDNRDGIVYVSDADAATQIANAFDPVAYMIGSKKQEIAAQWWLHLNSGHTTAGGVTLKTDTVSLSLINGAAQRAATGGSTFNFIDASSNWIELTADQMTTLFDDVSAWVQALFSYRSTLETQIAAAQTWQDAQAIDVTINWPE